MSAKYRRKKNEEQLLLALACGASVDRRLKDPATKQRLLELREQIIDRNCGALTAASTEAVRTLLDLIKPAVAPTVRLGAARAILEIGMKIREIAELERRLTELEVRLAEAEAEERKSEKW